MTDCFGEEAISAAQSFSLEIDQKFDKKLP